MIGCSCTSGQTECHAVCGEREQSDSGTSCATSRLALVASLVRIVGIDVIKNYPVVFFSFVQLE